MRFLNVGINDGTSVLVFVVVGLAVALLIVVVIIGLVCLRNYPIRFKRASPSVNTDVNMYASPAYGSHQVHSEPGLEHLYEYIKDVVATETDTALDEVQSETSKNTTDQYGYLKMPGSTDNNAPDALTPENDNTDQLTGNSTIEQKAVDEVDQTGLDAIGADDGGYEQQEDGYLQIQL